MNFWPEFPNLPATVKPDQESNEHSGLYDRECVLNVNYVFRTYHTNRRENQGYCSALLIGDEHHFVFPR